MPGAGRPAEQIADEQTAIVEALITVHVEHVPRLTPVLPSLPIKNRTNTKPVYATPDATHGTWGTAVAQQLQDAINALRATQTGVGTAPLASHDALHAPLALLAQRCSYDDADAFRALAESMHLEVPVVRGTRGNAGGGAAHVELPARRQAAGAGADADADADADAAADDMETDDGATTRAAAAAEAHRRSVSSSLSDMQLTDLMKLGAAADAATLATLLAGYSRGHGTDTSEHALVVGSSTYRVRSVRKGVCWLACLLACLCTASPSTSRRGLQHDAGCSRAGAAVPSAAVRRWHCGRQGVASAGRGQLVTEDGRLADEGSEVTIVRDGHRCRVGSWRSCRIMEVEGSDGGGGGGSRPPSLLPRSLAHRWTVEACDGEGSDADDLRHDMTYDQVLQLPGAACNEEMKRRTLWPLKPRELYDRLGLSTEGLGNATDNRYAKGFDGLAPHSSTRTTLPLIAIKLCKSVMTLLNNVRAPPRPLARATLSGAWRARSGVTLGHARLQAAIAPAVE
jgi:hypothetical protein